jgi:hypothetical protein
VHFAYFFQVWPPKSGSYLLIVLLMMGILVPETCWGNKAAYFAASSWFFTFHYVYDVRSHEHHIPSFINPNSLFPEEDIPYLMFCWPSSQLRSYVLTLSTWCTLHIHFTVDVQCLDMFRALLAHPHYTDAELERYGTRKDGSAVLPCPATNTQLQFLF